jgi:hypothetical protein
MTLSNSTRIKANSSMHTMKNIHRDIEKKGFTDVLIRDYSEFSLKKWSKI